MDYCNVSGHDSDAEAVLDPTSQVGIFVRGLPPSQTNIQFRAQASGTELCSNGKENRRRRGRVAESAAPEDVPSNTKGNPIRIRIHAHVRSGTNTLDLAEPDASYSFHVGICDE